MVDKSGVIVEESIRRMISECVECMKDSNEVTLDPIQELVEPEEMRRLAALNNVMVRIIRSVQWN